MTTITRDDILKLATLGSLSLGDDEISALQIEIGNIISYVEQLDELDTSGIAPAYQVTGLENITRSDEVQTSSVSREDMLALTLESKDSQIKVPKVL